jgi:hypothetical protein
MNSACSYLWDDYSKLLSGAQSLTSSSVFIRESFRFVQVTGFMSLSFGIVLLIVALISFQFFKWKEDFWEFWVAIITIVGLVGIVVLGIGVELVLRTGIEPNVVIGEEINKICYQNSVRSK